MMLTILLSLPILLLAEHVYTPVSSLEAFVIVKFTLTLVTFPFPVRMLTLSLTDTLLLNVPLVLFNITVGGGKPNASHVIVIVLPSLTIVSLNVLTVATPIVSNVCKQ